MDINFEILQAKALIEYLELDKYIYIMQVKYKKEEKDEFIKKYKTFYDMNRNLPKGFDKEYFKYFEKHDKSNSSFPDILKFLNSKFRNRVDASFSSKLLATIDPKMPVWDKNVSKSLDKIYSDKEIFKLDDYRKKWSNEIKGNSPKEKMMNAKKLYENLIEIQKDMLKKEEIISQIKNFKNYYKNILKKILLNDEKYCYVKNYVEGFDFTDEKILDFFLWKLK